MSTETIRTGEREIPFNTEATHWLGIWLDSHLTLKDHQRAMMKKGRKALVRLRRLAGQMGLTSGNCRKVMTACVQSVAMYGIELWWKGKGKPGMSSGAGELQKLVNQEARAVTGRFRTTNLGALAMESGLRPAAAQLDNRQRRFAARLLSLPAGSEARGIVGAQSAIGRRLETSIGYSGRMEETKIMGKPEKIEAVRIVEDREGAIEEAEKDREGVGIYGSIKGEDCVSVLCGHKISLYTGRPSGQRTEDCLPSRCSGTQSCPDASSSPDATSGLSCPDASASPDATLF